MPTYYPATRFVPQFLDPEDGELLSRGSISAFLAGTNIPTQMFLGKTGQPAGETVALNAGGYPEVSGVTSMLWLELGIDYKFILRDRFGRQKWLIDDIVNDPVPVNVQINPGQVEYTNLSSTLQNFIDQISENTTNIAQEATNLSAQIQSETISRIAAVQNAISEAAASDDALRLDIVSAESAASNAQSDATAALNNSGVILTRINDTLGDGSSQTVEALAQQSQNLVSAVSSNTSDILIAQADATAALTDSASALTRINDVAGDGSNVSIEALTSTVNTAESSIITQAGQISGLDSRTGAIELTVTDVYGNGSGVDLQGFAATVDSLALDVQSNANLASVNNTLSNNIQTRINDVNGDSSNVTIEALSSTVQTNTTAVSTANANASNALSQSSASIARLNDTLGDGSNVTIETVASQVDTIQTAANTANANASAAVTTANAVETRIDNVGSEPAISSIASQITTIDATATQASTDASNASAQVAIQAQAIADIENGVVAQWEVKANAGDITGAIGLYNDNGDTRVLITAEEFQIDRGSGPENIYSADSQTGVLALSYQSLRPAIRQQKLETLGDLGGPTILSTSQDYNQTYVFRPRFSNTNAGQTYQLEIPSTAGESNRGHITHFIKVGSSFVLTITAGTNVNFIWIGETVPTGFSATSITAFSDRLLTCVFLDRDPDDTSGIYDFGFYYS